VKHVKFLKLDSLEKGINSNARQRAVDIHGGKYVSNSFIQNNKRLGRSLGCSVLPLERTNNFNRSFFGIIKKSCPLGAVLRHCRFP
jgi:hypothetical protein